MMIFNQFEEMGNPLWHYNVTGYALADLFEAVKKPGQQSRGRVLHIRFRRYDDARATSSRNVIQA